jgi:diguanylate cyclase (GGDEF)-like protein
VSQSAGRHLRAVEKELDPFEALRRAVRAATAAPDLTGALDAIARCLAAAVGAHTTLLVAADAPGPDAQAATGLTNPRDALHLAVHSESDAHGDVVIRYIGADSEVGLEPSKGAVLVVLPTGESKDAARIAEIVQAFAELAELCVVHAQRLQQVERHSELDTLTQCLTRRTIERALGAELARSGRSGVPFSIAFLDIDGFKRINDDQGHVRGDAVLRMVGGALRRSARATDFVGRYGGDEFLVVMPGTDAEAAAAACARLAAGVAAAVQEGELPELGLSYGTATWEPHKSAVELIEEADRAMFAAKRSRDAE